MSSDVIEDRLTNDLLHERDINQSKGGRLRGCLVNQLINLIYAIE